MKKALLFLLIFPNLAFATIIAACSNPAGYAYFPNYGLIQERDSGWTDDAITGGITQLVQEENGDFDIMVLDSTQTIYSSRNEGAMVIPFSFNESQVSVLVVFMGETVETYSFIKTASGKNEFLMTQNRTKGVIPKFSLYRGECSFVNLDFVNLD